jgi:hypothetical protein
MDAHAARMRSAQLDWKSIADDLSMSSPEAARVRAARLKPRVANLSRKIREGQYPVSEAYEVCAEQSKVTSQWSDTTVLFQFETQAVRAIAQPLLSVTPIHQASAKLNQGG